MPKQTAGAIAVQLEQGYDIPHSEVYDILYHTGAIKAFRTRYQIGLVEDVLRERVKDTQKEIANLKALAKIAYRQMTEAQKVVEHAFSVGAVLAGDEIEEFEMAARKHLRVVRARSEARERLKVLEEIRYHLNLLITAPKHLGDQRDDLVNKWIREEFRG